MSQLELPVGNRTQAPTAADVMLLSTLSDDQIAYSGEYWRLLKWFCLHGYCLFLLCVPASGQEFRVTERGTFRVTERLTVSHESTAPPRPWLAMFTAGYCQPCRNWKNTEKAQIEAAGFFVREYDIADKKNARYLDRIHKVPTFVVCDWEDGQWLSEPIVGAEPADSLLGRLRNVAGVSGEVDGVCRLHFSGGKWSGVVIAPGQILTVAHPRPTGRIVAEFPRGSEYVAAECIVVRSDANADLMLLRFDGEKVKTKVYQVGRGEPNRVRGYLSGESPVSVRLKRSQRTVTADGYTFRVMLGEGISSPQHGVSGAPLLDEASNVVGIQAMGKANEIYSLPPETISEFLARKSQSAVQKPSNGRYAYWAGKKYDLEKWTRQCSMRDCDMCQFLDNAAAAYRRTQTYVEPPPSPQSSTPDDVIQEAISIAKLTPEDVVVELGSGAGIPAIRMAQASGCRVVGVEIDPEQVAVSRRNIEAAGLSDRITIVQGDVTKFDPSDYGATVVYAYLETDLLHKIKPQLSVGRMTICPGHFVEGLGFKLVGQCWVRT